MGSNNLFGFCNSEFVFVEKKYFRVVVGEHVEKENHYYCICDSKQCKYTKQIIKPSFFLLAYRSLQFIIWRGN
jgi:hypothetical protein